MRTWPILLLSALPAAAFLHEPTPLEITEPGYSPEASRAELEGVVVLSARIGSDGLVRDIRVDRPLGLGLDERAVEALGMWRFEPARRDGAAIDYPVRLSVPFVFPDKTSRWHLIGLAFESSAGTAPPRLLTNSFPPGAGVSSEVYEHASVVLAVNRSARVMLSFDIDPGGVPQNIVAEQSTDPIWEKQAAAVLQGWRFSPATRDGAPTNARATVTLAWGRKALNKQSLLALASTQSIGEGTNATIRGDYTEEAVNLRVEGVVTVSFRLGEAGKPADIRVVKGLGHGLDEKAIEAVSRMTLRYNGQNLIPENSEHTIGVAFRLHEIPRR